MHLHSTWEIFPTGHYAKGDSAPDQQTKAHRLGRAFFRDRGAAHSYAAALIFGQLIVGKTVEFSGGKMTEIKRLDDALTIQDLRNRLDEAIAIAGEDATWNGFDDEAIYIYPKNGCFLSIFPGKNKENP